MDAKRKVAKPGRNAKVQEKVLVDHDATEDQQDTKRVRLIASLTLIAGVGTLLGLPFALAGRGGVFPPCYRCTGGCHRACSASRMVRASRLAIETVGGAVRRDIPCDCDLCGGRDRYSGNRLGRARSRTDRSRHQHASAGARPLCQSRTVRGQYRVAGCQIPERPAARCGSKRRIRCWGLLRRRRRTRSSSFSSLCW